MPYALCPMPSSHLSEKGYTNGQGIIFLTKIKVFEAGLIERAITCLKLWAK